MMRRATLALLFLFSAPTWGQVCPVAFTEANYPSVEGFWNTATTEARLFDNLLGLCGANVEDFGTGLADDCVLEAQSGAITCGAGGGGGVEGAQYHPDRAPSTGLVTASSDEFEGGFDTTWRWANQGGATDTAELDTGLLATTGGGSANLRVRWVDAPTAGTDFTLSGKFTPAWSVITGGSASARLCGLIVLVAGSEATPTAMRTLHLREAGTGVLNLRHGTTADYTTAPTSVAEQSNSGALTQYGGFYLQLRYAQASKVLSSYVSSDGMTWVPLGSETLSAHPISIGRFVNSSEASGTPVQCRAMWYRTCSSAACLAGEVGG